MRGCRHRGEVAHAHVVPVQISDVRLLPLLPGRTGQLLLRAWPLEGTECLLLGLGVRHGDQTASVTELEKVVLARSHIGGCPLGVQSGRFGVAAYARAQGRKTGIGSQPEGRIVETATAADGIEAEREPDPFLGGKGAVGTRTRDDRLGLGAAEGLAAGGQEVRVQKVLVLLGAVASARCTADAVAEARRAADAARARVVAAPGGL